MNHNSFKAWVEALGQAWTTLNPQGAEKICAEGVRYYETPFGEPLRSPAEVGKTWKSDLAKQKDVVFKFDIISVADNVGVAHWSASFTRTDEGIRDDMDGIFVVSLNDKNLCTEFHQWWAIKKPRS